MENPPPAVYSVKKVRNNISCFDNYISPTIALFIAILISSQIFGFSIYVVLISIMCTISSFNLILKLRSFSKKT